jgi:opacity protein-like surface antigen
MTITTKLSVVAVLALLIAAPAQAADWSQKGDFYAPVATVVQQPTAAQMKQAEEGDFYAPTATIVQRPTATELKQAEEGDFYAPVNGN